LIAVSAVPIPSVPLPVPPPAYIGAPASAHPIRGVPRTPQNPHMSPNGTSSIHNDGWQTNAFTWGGPLGRSPQELSTMIIRDCGSITFDSQGRVVSVCVGASGPQLYMFDPNTLATLATFSLPPRQTVPSNLFQDYTGGGYFELKRTADLGETFTRVAEELHSQYVLGFSPETFDGKVHKLDVRVKKTGMVARARKTYVATRTESGK